MTAHEFEEHLTNTLFYITKLQNIKSIADNFTKEPYLDIRQHGTKKWIYTVYTTQTIGHTSDSSLAYD